MVGVFVKPRISPFLVARIERLHEGLEEDEEDIRDGLKALADEEGTVTWEQYQHQRAGQEPKGELPS